MERQGVIKDKDVKVFILAGKSIFTAKNIEQETHITFRVVKKEYSKSEIEYSEDTGIKLEDMWFVSVQSQYGFFTYVGVIRDNKFQLTTKSPSSECKSVMSFDYIFNHYIRSNKFDKRIVFYHEGRCAKCGRSMNDPDSIERGMGPKCYRVSTTADWLNNFK